MSKVSIVQTRASLGLDAPLVIVEVDIIPGLPALNIVGLPETSVRESKDRVRSALINCGYQFPMTRITINLAPADLPKKDARFDLPIALGILAASEQIPIESLKNYEFFGELALTGELRPISGSLPLSIAATKINNTIFLPVENSQIACRYKKSKVIAANHLLEVCGHLTNKASLPFAQLDNSKLYKTQYPDISDIKGQQQAKRALSIAAAGGHHILFYGPPGTGKTMLASRLPGLLPELTDQESLEVSAIHSLADNTQKINWKERPFRNPHHTSSAVSLVGGGTHPTPGEISFAHNGILFLDELPEFQRLALEVLREPMETGEVIITRAKGQAIFPAHFQLIAAMNPCPCGFLGDKLRSCQCTVEQIKRYKQKISGPLLNRIDLQVEVSTQNAQILFTDTTKNEDSTYNSQNIQLKVEKNRQLQINRQGKINTKLNSKEINTFCKLRAAEQKYLTLIANKLGFSARAIHRVLKVARTIADLENSINIQKQHLAEAIQYRKLDRAS